MGENDKVERLIDYLQQLARINSKIIRTLDEYPVVLWLSDIPKELKYCYVKGWEIEDGHVDDTWIEVRKYREPKLPKVPKVCSEWVDSNNLKNIDAKPELKSRITFSFDAVDRETGQTTKEYAEASLEDCPETTLAWDKYVLETWLPWTEEYHKYAKIQFAYEKIFHIHQELLRMGEQYELVLSFGLLIWKSPSGQNVKRHIITAKASLEFEPHLGKFAVRPSLDQNSIGFEFDMLEVQDQPINLNRITEESKKQLAENVWDKAAVDAVLSSITNSLSASGRGDYYPDATLPTYENISQKPVVLYSPALILRKRTMSGLVHFLDEMKRNINRGEEAPIAFLDLGESKDKSYLSRNGVDGGRESGALNSTQCNAQTVLGATDEIYFPLPANDEQRRIIKTITSQEGVLVQGPPGTGKSHTIANIICHHLATGKRILVTAKTPRALQVLHDKLPDKIKPLCINMLGNGMEERASLEKSIVGILGQLDGSDEVNAANEIETTIQRIRDNKGAKAEVDNKLLALREADTYVHTVAGGAYIGTAALIARNINEESDKFKWFTDAIDELAEMPLTKSEVEELCIHCECITVDDERELTYAIPPFETLQTPEVIRNLFIEEKKNEQSVGMVNHLLSSDEAKILLNAGKAPVVGLSALLDDLSGKYRTMAERPIPWIGEALYDVLTDKEMPWKERLRLSKLSVDGLKAIAESVHNVNVELSSGLDRRKLAADATGLRDHIVKGGGMGFWILKPQAVRKHGAFLNKVKVNGQLCDNKNSLDLLISYLSVDLKLESVWKLWPGKPSQHSESFLIQIAEIEEFIEALKLILEVYDLKEKARRDIGLIKGIQTPRWENIDSLRQYIELFKAVLKK